MLCEICHIKEATIKLTQIVNYHKKEITVCKECAEEKGLLNPMVGLQKIFGNLLLLGQLKQEQDSGNADSKDVNLRCNRCDTTWADVQKDGLLGCKDCYIMFDEKLKILLRRVHGSNKHIGNRPASHRVVINDCDLDILRKKLNNAIRQENFERAAELRDRIRDIEAGLNKKKT